MKPIKFESEVLDIKEVSVEVKIFRFSAPDEFVFEPGQFFSLIIKVSGKAERRSYSISSHGKGFVETCIDKIENGRVSPVVHELKKGSKVTIQGPLGTFNIKKDAPEKKNCFIATGTGVTPFVAMIPALLEKSRNKVILLAGYKHEDEVLYDEYFRQLKNHYGNFEYHAIISRPKGNYKGDIGRVQKLIEKHIPMSFIGDFYLCGLFDMIKDVGKLLTERKVPKESIIFERYD